MNTKELKKLALALTVSTMVLYGTLGVEGQWIFDNNTLKNETAGWEFTATVVDATAKTFKIADKGWLSGSGDLDLSTEIKDSAGDTWECVGLGDKFLEHSLDGSVAAVTSVIVPKTLTAFSNLMLNLSGGKTDVLTNLVLECPKVTGLSDSPNVNPIIRRQAKLKRLVFRCPKITIMQAGSFRFQGAALSATDFDEWDLSGMTTLAPNTTTTSSFSRNDATGTLRLPVIQTIAADFFNSLRKVDAIELGTNGCTVTSIGADAFSGDCGAKRLVIGGAESGYAIAENAFTLQNLKQVTFLSETTPTVPVTSGKGMFGQTDPSALSCCFHVPESAAWVDLLGTLVEATDAEKQTFTANGGMLPSGTLYVFSPNATLGTKERQFVTYLHSPVQYSLCNTDLTEADATLSVVDSRGA